MKFLHHIKSQANLHVSSEYSVIDGILTPYYETEVIPEGGEVIETVIDNDEYRDLFSSQKFPFIDIVVDDNTPVCVSAYMARSVSVPAKDAPALFAKWLHDPDLVSDNRIISAYIFVRDINNVSDDDKTTSIKAMRLRRSREIAEHLAWKRLF